MCVCEGKGNESCVASEGRIESTEAKYPGAVARDKGDQRKKEFVLLTLMNGTM